MPVHQWRRRFVTTSQIVQQTYNRCSSLYDLVLKPWLAAGRAEAVQLLDPVAGDRVLEIGVGTGLNFEYYPTGIDVIGFDYSEGMLQQAARAAKDASCPIHLTQMDVQKMAFPDDSFSKIVAAYVMTVVPNTAQAVRELIRVARPGARVVFINHLRPTSPFLAWLEDLTHPLFARIGLFTLDRDLLGILGSFPQITDLEIKPTSEFRLHYIISFTVRK